MKVKVQEVDLEKLKEIKAANIIVAQLFYISCPFTNKVHMALKTRLPYNFIKDNWEQITSVIK